MQKEIALIHTGQDTVSNTTACSVPVAEVTGVTEAGTPTYCGGKYTAFCYSEGDSLVHKFWMVPKRFKFPCVDRINAWSYWLLGMPKN